MLLLALLAPLLQLAAAAPTGDAADASNHLIAKRGDGIHLVNCDSFGGEGTVMPQRSYVVYCPNDSSCSQPPSSDNICTMSTNFWFTWEGRANACTFSTGTKFQWFINADAQNQANYVHVGDGGNQFRAYTGFKDDKHGMFNEGPSQCHSIYYFT
ncbi:hypothetical protein GQ53DRAFT_520283 [Thozetella sp. PMI_491]|nr:hypothetical protein GQ53DRAFT_520283 [Thozetella sp. PMI_491]